MLPASEEQKSQQSLMLEKVSKYMNQKHGTNYMVYNFFMDR